MTGIIAIDECGNLGKNGSRFFIMSATMSCRSRNLLQASKIIGNHRYEEKYKNTSDEKITRILNTLSESNIVISYIVVDKYDYNSDYYNIYGNRLYHKVLNELLDAISYTAPTTEMNVLLDRSSSISEIELEHLCYSINGIRIKKCTKFNSSSNRCLQIADFVAGAIWHMYERNEREHFSIIEKKVRRP